MSHYSFNEILKCFCITYVIYGNFLLFEIKILDVLNVEKDQNFLFLIYNQK